jgi:hypothetical protein
MPSPELLWVPHFSRPLRKMGESIKSDLRSIPRSLLTAHGAQINPQLLRFLI